MENIEVYKAINAVQDDMAKIGISKDKVNKIQGYNFRGIDDVYGALAPLLAKHKLCIIPYTLDRTAAERTTKAGGVLFYVTVHCEFHFISAVDGSKHIARTFGEAMDSGDKATNKALSAAYKYAAFQTFCIPVDGVDADSETHEVVSKTKVAPAPTSVEKGIVNDDVPDVISEAQGKRLYAMSKTSEITVDKLKLFLKHFYNIEHSKDIKKVDYTTICDLIGSKDKFTVMMAAIQM